MKLSPELEALVCNCKNRFNNSGWSFDPDTGYWVHKHHFLKGDTEPCGKPSRFSAVKECEECDEYYIPKQYDPNEITFLCDTCRELYY